MEKPFSGVGLGYLVTRTPEVPLSPLGTLLDLLAKVRPSASQAPGAQPANRRQQTQDRGAGSQPVVTLGYLSTQLPLPTARLVSGRP